jgi:ribosome-binding protein aMBF1 (putative translation factor)
MTPRSRSSATAGAAATAARSSAAATPTAGRSRPLAARELSRLVGANIRQARQARGIRQNQLAAALGLWCSSLCRIEAGTNLINAALLQRLAAALGLAASSLLPPWRAG